MMTLQACRERDDVDPLAPFAAAFESPPEGTIFLDANSMGALPRGAL